MVVAEDKEEEEAANKREISETKFMVAKDEEEEEAANKREISVEANVLNSSFDMLHTLEWTGGVDMIKLIKLLKTLLFERKRKNKTMCAFQSTAFFHLHQ